MRFVSALSRVQGDAKSASPISAVTVFFLLIIITIINFTYIESAHADAILYLCQSGNGASYQDRPCSVNDPTNTGKRQAEISITTADTGVNNGRSSRSAPRNVASRGYFSTPIAAPNSFHDSYTPMEIDIEKLRRDIKLANQALRCQAMRKELWRLDYAQQDSNAKTPALNSSTAQHPWTVRRRAVLQKHLQKDCQSS